MKKLILIPLIAMALTGCDKPKEESDTADTVVSKSETPTESNDSEVVADEGYQGYKGLLDSFARKEAGVLKDGNYQNITLIDKKPIEMTLVIRDGKMMKASRFLGTNEVFKASADYKIVGSTLAYDNISGDKFLFNPQGEPFVSLESSNFALVDICEPDLAEKIPDANEASDSDTFCKDNVLFTAYRITDTDTASSSK